MIKKLLVKVKNYYLKQKKDEQEKALKAQKLSEDEYKKKEQELKKIALTEEEWELVPLQVLDDTVAQMKNKIHEKRMTIISFKKECQDEIDKGIEK